MAASREKIKGRKESGRFLAIPFSVIEHPDFISLSSTAIRLLIEVSKQFNGKNNGALGAGFEIMRKRGFKSKTTLAKGLRELESAEFLIRTREGRFMNPGRRCALYALPWLAIDECPGKDLEVAPTQKPPRCFSAEIIKMPIPETGPTGTRNWTHKEKKYQ